MSHPHGAAGFVRLSDSTRRCCWCVVVSSPAEFAPFARASAGAVVRRVVASLAILGLMSSAAARAQTPMPPPCEPVAAWTDVGEPAPGYVLWGRAEYLLWWSRPERAPGPLVTTGLPGDPRQGALSNPTTRTLYDGSRLDTHDQSGVRLFLGGWLDAEQTLGVELGGFVLETHTIHGKADSNRTDGAPVIARPFFNTLSGLEDAQIITSPQDPLGGRYLGGIDVFADSRTWGGELNLVRNLQAGEPATPAGTCSSAFAISARKMSCVSRNRRRCWRPARWGFAARRRPRPTSSRSPISSKRTINSSAGSSACAANGRADRGALSWPARSALATRCRRSPSPGTRS